MSHRICLYLLAALASVAVSLQAQQPCPGFSIAVNSDEDKLMLAINGADRPQDQITALDKFVKDSPNSQFMPCVNEYYATANLKLKDYDKSIEFGEKDLALNYQDLNLLLALMRAYASSTKVSDTIFDVINRVPDQVSKDIGTPSRPPKATDEEWEKMQKEAQELAKDSHDYAVWTFFQVLPRITDQTQRLQRLDTFLKTYPDVEKTNAVEVNTIYFQTYQAQGNLDKTIEYGDKLVAADPNNVVALNALGLIYTFYLPHPSPEKGATYAQKALAAAQSLKKPEGVDDAAFKTQQNTGLGMAHLTIGYASLVRAERTGKIVPAIDELKLAGPLLEANPALQGQAYYFLAYAYERGSPPNHRGALDALNKAVALPGPMQPQSKTLLAKVKAAMR